MPSPSRSTSSDRRVLRARAFAKINRSLRVLGAAGDGYHELRTVFQSIALHDTLVFSRTRAALQIACRDPACPDGDANLVWKAAAAMWRAAGRDGPPRGITVRLTKRIPMQAGLGGGSSDAAAALRAFAKLWRVRLSRDEMAALAASLGADVPYFLTGGTVLGTGRGDVLEPLADAAAAWVVIVVPPFGVSTADAYAWWDASARAPARLAARPRGELAGNDLEPVVVARHPAIGELTTALRRAGAAHAAMSGSGSAVFGLFAHRRDAERAAEAVAGAGTRALVTRTVNRVKYQTLAAV